MFEETSDIVLDTQTPVSKWAPIVYGRTYAVDFRFLVIPDNFDDNLKDLLWQYIKVTTREAENLSGNPRWIFIRGKKRCVVGVTCMVRDLIGFQADNTPEDLTRDKLGRPLYTFVGYVSQDPMITAVPAMNLELFAEPYKEFVPKKWQEIYADLGSNQAATQELKSQYEREFNLEEVATEDLEAKKISIENLLTSGQNSIIFWNISNTRNIWFTASTNREPLSICFGNFNKRDLINSVYMNAAIDEKEGREEVEKVKKVSKTQLNSQFENSTYTQSPSQRFNEQVHSSSQSDEQWDSEYLGIEDDIYQTDKEEMSFIVSISKPGYEFTRKALGEGIANGLSFINRNTVGKIAEIRYGKENVNKMHEQIIGVDELVTELKKTIEKLEKLQKQRETLIAENREAELHKLNESIESLKKQKKDLKQELDDIEENSRSRRTNQSIQPRQTEKRAKTNPNLGFQDKEIMENKQIDSDTNAKKSSQSKDIWEL
ncbi:hypothetical protein [Calothrix sp. PCC 6303]|uniref:hypothetical protein n=1 Tax=Calothrix sp. PCC 6303 TaxID=1170562 RepID=UPI0002A00386|nr:hypothetical protein [Calothrix sp. PCC 6303]AFZ04565.1 hypothetical protein Cal6303_5694 [Calothrix sp. PCC 6303]